MVTKMFITQKRFYFLSKKEYNLTIMNRLKEEIFLRKTRKLRLYDKLENLKNDIESLEDTSNAQDLAFKINQVYQRCTLLKLKKTTYEMLLVFVDQIEKDIPKVIKTSGCSFDTFIKYYSVTTSDDDKKLLSKYFRIIKIETVNYDESIPELDPEFNENVRNKEPFVRKIYPALYNTLEENVHGAKVFLPYKDSYVILYGFFKDKFGFIQKMRREYNCILMEMKKQNLQEKFYCLYLQNSSVREILVNTCQEFITQMKNAHKDLKTLEKKSFNDVQRTFQNASIFKQRRMIMLLLLSEEKAKQYCIPLIESLKFPQDKFALKESLGELGNSLLDIKNEIQAQIKQFESSYDDISYHSKIMMLKVDKNVKSKALEKLKEANSGRESGTKAQQYVDGLLKVPFGVYKKETIFNNTCSEIKKNDYLVSVENTLENCVHGHKEAKRHIQRLIAQWINGKITGTVFGFQGPPGTGKTTLAKNGFAKCLIDDNGDNRPISFIPLGGSSSGSFLEGHGYTYMGSTWGKIVDVLIETQCMNPIIYIDELDKISQSERGQELIGILTHLTDSSQNQEFNDKYFSGVKFDLSQAIFIFSYNDSSKIDRILRDRITEIRTTGLSKLDKITVTNKFLLTEILDNTGIEKNQLHIPIECIEYIIDNYTFESGVRKLKERLYDVIREINLRSIKGNIQFPYTISNEIITEVFQDKPKVILPKLAKVPSVGLVNGLYANTLGIGGITLIEVHMTHGENLDLLLTGSQGKVMKESMQCAKTVALSLLNYNEEWNSKKIHIHCPEAATSKDGPSAGITVTTGVYSRLTGIPIRNDIAMTGEIDLNGNVHAIGGLEAKIFGAIQSGIHNLCIPRSNEHDLMRFKQKYEAIFETLNVNLVDSIQEVLDISLCKEEE